MGAISAADCCVDEYNDNKKESDKKKALVEQKEYENELEIDVQSTPEGYYEETKEPPTVPSTPTQLPPWNINSAYHNKLTYMEMSKHYQRYRKPPNFYDDCIRKLRSTKKRYQSTQKQGQYDSIIQNTSKSLLRTRTMLTASYEEEQQTSGTNLIRDISENDEKFWFQPFLYNVIDSITNAFIKLIDSKQDLLLTHIDFYHILATLPVLGDVLSKKYPFHFHSRIKDRLKYLFNVNDITYIKTKKDIIDLISRANKSNRKICAVGYATTIASNDDINSCDSVQDKPLIAAMIPSHLRNHSYDMKIVYSEDLSRASVTDYPLMYVQDIGNNKICVGGATPLWLYREWCHQRMKTNKPIISEPASIMSLNHSFVGLITVAEHGGGYMTKTLSDYVTKMTVINSDGIENEYSIENDEKEFKSLLPHLGLLGIVTEIELQFVDEYYCNLKVRVTPIDKLFPKSKSKKNKGRTFSKLFEDVISSTLYNEFFWFPTTNQIYSLSLERCNDMNVTPQFFPYKTWEKNWICLQREINILNEILSIQLLNTNTQWTAKLATKLITKLNINLLNDLVIKLNYKSKIRATSSPRASPRTHITPTMKLASCDALHLFEFYPSQSNNNLFKNIEWLFPLDSKSGKKILINDHHMPNVELAAHLFMSAINCYNQNMLKRKYYPYQHALNLKVIKGSQCKLSHCNASNGADFYCTLNMNVYNIKYNQIFQQFHKEFIQTCTLKVYSGHIDGIKPHWRNAQIFNYMPINYNKKQYKNGYKNGQNNHNENVHEIDENDIYSFIQFQYKQKFDKLNEIRYRDNKNPKIFEQQYLQKVLH